MSLLYVDESISNAHNILILDIAGLSIKICRYDVNHGRITLICFVSVLVHAGSLLSLWKKRLKIPYLNTNLAKICSTD
jgi:hypothetical protein